MAKILDFKKFIYYRAYPLQIIDAKSHATIDAKDLPSYLCITFHGYNIRFFQNKCKYFFTKHLSFLCLILSDSSNDHLEICTYKKTYGWGPYALIGKNGKQHKSINSLSFLLSCYKLVNRSKLVQYCQLPKFLLLNPT